MRTTAKIHVHPACTHSPAAVEAIQQRTGCLVVVGGGKPHLKAQPRPYPFDPNDGGHAA
ncbi:hypothetical protein [Pseudomonas sp. MYb185]|uniref:hypothetical protein n=1 Tax=Pseudomonas sp. MYb185 TaxID=1848729 RepID=UPI0015A782A2|nr:hypothetical protein [Pseudomonas sp. MYb185]